MNSLPWPAEAAHYPNDSVRSFEAPGSNWVLDFHGDPCTAGLAVYSDGNHHMALEAAVRAYVTENPAVGDVFYTTTPPAPLVDALKGDGLVLGNLRISRKPEVFIGPDNILQNLAAEGLVSRHLPFAASRGNVLLVRKGNPKGIATVSDLLSDEVSLACSNPVTEKASFSVYLEALGNLADAAGIDRDALVTKLSVAGPRGVHSQIIHHREVPEIVASGRADAAMIYYHLALRYTRIFPGLFEFVDIAGVMSSEVSAGNPTTRYHIGPVGAGGQWGEDFIAFMLSDKAQSLYQLHGLARVH